MSGAKRKAVVQGYPSGLSGTDNPYPSVRSGALAILARRQAVPVEQRNDPEIVLAPPPEVEPPPDAFIWEPQEVSGRPTIGIERMRPGSSPGAIFDSADAAARAMLEATNLFSKAENTEYLSAIYKDRHGKYGFTDPQRTSDRGNSETRLPPPPGRLVGIAHTHANYMNDFTKRVGDPNDDSFKSDDFSSGDYAYMRRNRDRFEGAYLGTPSGSFYKWTSKGGKVSF